MKIFSFIAAVLMSQAVLAQKSTIDCENEVGKLNREKVAKCLVDSIMESSKDTGEKSQPLAYSLKIDGINSVGAVKISVNIFNIFDKPIKYVNLSMRVFNAVKDDVSTNALGQKKTSTFQITGPIHPNESDLYSWPSAWYSPTAHCLTIENLEVIFMSNEKEQISGKDKRIRNSKCD
jgi:hypothetical protein